MMKKLFLLNDYCVQLIAQKYKNSRDNFIPFYFAQK